METVSANRGSSTWKGACRSSLHDGTETGRRIETIFLEVIPSAEGLSTLIAVTSELWKKGEGSTKAKSATKVLVAPQIA